MSYLRSNGREIAYKNLNYLSPFPQRAYTASGFAYKEYRLIYRFPTFPFMVMPSCKHAYVNEFFFDKVIIDNVKRRYDCSIPLKESE